MYSMCGGHAEFGSEIGWPMRLRMQKSLGKTDVFDDGDGYFPVCLLAFITPFGVRVLCLMVCFMVLISGSTFVPENRLQKLSPHSNFEISLKT